LAVIDDFTRECLALVADTSLSGARVARELDRIIRLYGKPQMIVSDNVIAFLRDIDRDEHSFLCDIMYLGHGQAAPLWWWLE
jgi:transposase InsO family protein